MILLSNGMLSVLSKRAGNSLCRRKHFNICSYYQDSSQRFINAIQINSYIHPHRHSILLEVKEDPFNPDEAKELPPWAPKEGSQLGESFLEKCYKYSKINSVFLLRYL